MRYEQLLGQENKKTEKPKNNVRENETYAKILHTATELFIQNGYKSVTLRDIAAHAGVNLGLISYYFTSKENLGNTVYSNLAEAALGEVEKIDLSEFSEMEQIYIAFAVSCYCLEHHPNYSRYLRFYYEFIESRAMVLFPTRYIEERANMIIKKYNLNVPRDLNKLYLEIMKMTENHLVLKRVKGDKTVTQRLEINLSFSNYLYNIGLPDEMIADAIMKGSQFMDNYKFSFEEEKGQE